MTWKCWVWFGFWFTLPKVPAWRFVHRCWDEGTLGEIYSGISHSPGNGKTFPYGPSWGLKGVLGSDGALSNRKQPPTEWELSGGSSCPGSQEIMSRGPVETAAYVGPAWTHVRLLWRSPGIPCRAFQGTKFLELREWRQQACSIWVTVSVWIICSCRLLDKRHRGCMRL